MSAHDRAQSANRMAATASAASSARNSKARRKRPQPGPQSPTGGSQATGTNGKPGSNAPGASGLDLFLDRLMAFFTSMRLTVVCLVLGMLLVFWGTMAQVDLGLYKVQNEFFRSFLVFWGPKGASWRIPVMPGGYLVGGVLLINLVASHFKRFRFSRDKAGIWMVHLGLILLLLGQLMTDILSRESTLHLREGETKNYSEAAREAELAITDTSGKNLNTVVAIPQGLLSSRKEIHSDQLPFVLRVKRFYVNSIVQERATNSTAAPAATQGLGRLAEVRQLPHVTTMDRRDVPSAVVEVVTPQGSAGTWLVSEYLNQPQSFTLNGRTYQLTMRPRRYYKPYSIELLKFRHDVYPGTDIPKNFSSRVRLLRPDTGENREVLIYMNNPLRYAGETYYQASYDPDDHGSVLQVVHNPSWLTPYFACVLVGVGLVLQFAIQLFGFTFKRKAA